METVWLYGCGKKKGEVKDLVKQVMNQIRQGKIQGYDYNNMSARLIASRCFAIRDIMLCFAKGLVVFSDSDNICWFASLALEPTNPTVTLTEAVKKIKGDGKRLCKGFFVLPKNLEAHDDETYDECLMRCSEENYHGLPSDYEKVFACEESECDILQLDPEERIARAVRSIIDFRVDHEDVSDLWVQGVGTFNVEYETAHYDIKDLGLRIYRASGEICGDAIPCPKDYIKDNFEIYCIEPIYNH